MNDKIYPSMVIRSQAEAIELLEKENAELKDRIEKAVEKINFYETTEWGLKSYEILELFREILKGDRG